MPYFFNFEIIYNILYFYLYKIKIYIFCYYSKVYITINCWF